MGNTGDHIRGFAHRMTYEEYEELEDTVTETKGLIRPF